MLERIKARTSKLEEVRTYLKSEFIGLDKIIDDIINNIRAWYVIPELITKPVIINLWGLTGVGKTDLVRKLVAKLEYQDRFMEMQMDTTADTYTKSVNTLLSNSGVEVDEPGIVLFDEIQKFRTIDEVGADPRDLPYQDLWMLLSDGSFEGKSAIKNDLINMMMDIYYDKETNKNEETVEDVTYSISTDKNGLSKSDISKQPKKSKYQQSTWDASHFKAQLLLKEPLEEIMTWNDDKKLDKIEDALNHLDRFSGKKYAKLLIFISGNIDEAYSMADDVDDVDYDADILHKHSLNISFIDIKTALLQRFRPEQIARFGNTHIIYPSLSRKSYEDIITMSLTKIINNVYKQVQIKVSFTPNILAAIYENGVFPAQGVRPVFSTIASMVEAQIPQFLLLCLESKIKILNIDFEDKQLITDINGRQSIDINCDVETLKDNITLDQKTLVAVHESSHALMYMLLNHVVPAQIKCKKVNVGGYVETHHSLFSRDRIKNQIKVSLAGYIGEELFFGPAKRTNGCQEDIMKATRTASRYIRLYAMHNTLSRISYPVDDETNQDNLDISSSNDEIETILKGCEKDVRFLLEQHQNIIIKIVDELLLTDSIKTQRLYDIVNPEVPFKLEIVEPDVYLSDKYSDLYKNTKGSQNVKHNN